MEPIIITAIINAPSATVWAAYTDPEAVKQWNNASDDWHTPSARSDLRVDGKFSYRMEAKDGSVGFDFEGTFREVEPNKKLSYTIADGRNVEVTFAEENGVTTVTVTFEAESENPVEMQRAGWQAILDNFKKYVEK